MKKNTGFTILELLISITITGILSTATIVPLTGALDKAGDARKIVDIKNIGKALEYDRGVTTNYKASAQIPTSIGTFLRVVPKNNETDDKKYEWFSNVGNPGVYCVWATMKKGNSDGEKFYVSNRFGSGYSDTEPTSIVDCEYFKEVYVPSEGADVDDNDEVNDDVIADPKKDKVAVCHNTGKKNKTRLVQRQALNAHLNHGDYLGPCI